MDLAETISRAAFTIHQSLAMFTRIPIFAIEQPEAKELGKATANLMEHYDIAGTISPKAFAWMEFASVAGTIYGTRLMAIAGAVRAEKAEKRAAERQNSQSIYVPPESNPGDSEAVPPQGGKVDFGGAALARAMSRQGKH